MVPGICVGKVLFLRDFVGHIFCLLFYFLERVPVWLVVFL